MSPHLIQLVSSRKKIIRSNIDAGFIVIVLGDGGIPVIKKGERFIDVEAVIDKDLSACCLAIDIKANILLILTDINKVALNYNTSEHKFIDVMNIEEAKKHLAEGHFKEGSMKPKV